MKFRYIEITDILSSIFVLVLLMIGLFVFYTITQSIGGSLGETEEISTLLNITQFGENYINHFPIIIIVLSSVLILSLFYKMAVGGYGSDDVEEEPETSKKPSPLSQLFDNESSESQPKEPETQEQPERIDISRFKSDEKRKKYNWKRGEK